MPAGHRDISVAKIAATASVIASLIGAIASVAVAWVSARAAAKPAVAEEVKELAPPAVRGAAGSAVAVELENRVPAAVEDAIVKQGVEISRLRDSTKEIDVRLGGLRTQLGELGPIAYCKLPDAVVGVEPRKATIINFSEVKFDRLEAVFDKPTWRFAPKKPGLYNVSASIGVSGSPGDFITVGLFKNRGADDSTADVYLARQELGPQSITLGNAAFIDLTERDYFDIRAYVEGANSAKVGGAGLTWIRISYLGPLEPAAK